jgi:sulfate transport system permease protein
MTWLGLIVMLPLAALALRAADGGGAAFWRTATDPRVLASLRLSFGAAFAAAAVNAVFGFVVAWTLVRYRFPGRSLADALVDLPFALPTAVSGIARTTLYAPGGWLGGPLAALGIKAAYTPLEVTIALTFIGLPFVVRTLQPAIADLETEVGEAAASLGASRRQTFLRVIVPAVSPALLTDWASPSRERWASTAPWSSLPATCRCARRSRRS